MLAAFGHPSAIIAAGEYGVVRVVVRVVRVLSRWPTIT